MLIPFRYKLTLIIALVALLIISLAFTFVDREVEKEFRIVIEQRLLLAQDIVNQRMEDRFYRLYGQLVTASESKLTQDVLTDRLLSRETCDDIIHDEILPSLTQADGMIVTDGDGELLADSNQTDLFWQRLRKESGFEDGIAGEEAAGLIVLDGRWLQWILMPVFIGDQLFGTVVLVSVLGEQELRVISRLTGTELLIIHDDAYLATGWQDHENKGSYDAKDDERLMFEDLVMNTQKGSYDGIATREINLEGERYLLRHILPPIPFTPEFVVAQSLDSALSFVDSIKQVMIVIALAGLFIAAVLGFLLALGVSSPIQSLQRATRAIADEDFSHRVTIRTHDEFHELGQAFNDMSESLAEKAKIRSALDKSVSHDVAEHLLQKGVKLGGETREVTILFADIRSFTFLSEQLSENQLLELLNAYFARVNGCIEKYHGTIDKFIGDAIMAIFGAPFDDAKHATHAIQAAQAMYQAVAEFNEEASDRYGCEIKIGIGICSGKVIAGMVGSSERLNYTVIGDAVNVASRLEGLTKEYAADLIVAEDTKNAVMHTQISDCPVDFRRLDRVQVLGKTVGLDIFQPIKASKSVDERLQPYHQALDLMLNQKFNKAVYLLEKYTLRWSSDRVAQRLLERCKDFAKHPDHFQKDYSKGIRILDFK